MRGDGPITLTQAAPSGVVELVHGREHFERVVLGGMLQAKVSLDIATADFKAMMVPPGNGPTRSGRRAGSGGRFFSGGHSASGGRSGSGGGAESIVSHLVKLADKGVEVRLLHAGVPSEPTLRVLRQFYRRAGAAGDGVRGRITIRRCPRLHAKAVIVDAAAMYLGSANLTGAGLGAKVEANRNFEWGIWTESSDLIDGVLDHFNRLWEGEHCDGCGRKDVCPVPLEEPRLG